MHRQYSTAQQWIDAGIRKEEDAEVVRVLGWLLLLFDAIPAVFIWVGLRTGSWLWLWWSVVEAAAGFGILGVAAWMYAEAARMIARGRKQQGAEARAAEAAARVPESLAA